MMMLAAFSLGVAVGLFLAVAIRILILAAIDGGQP